MDYINVDLCIFNTRSAENQEEKMHITSKSKHKEKKEGIATSIQSDFQTS